MKKFGKKNHVNIDPLFYNTLLLGESKIGKEQPISEPVLTEDGWKRMGDIKVGTKVYGEDGKLHNVTDVFPQGIKDVYKVTFRDGTSTRCGLEHLWRVETKKQRENNRKYEDNRHMIIPLSQIIKDYKKYIIDPNHSSKGMYAYKYSIPIANAMSFDNNVQLPLNPYALGLLLGDGGFTGSVLTFTNAEDELFDELSVILKDIDIELHYRDYKNHKQANLCSGSSNENKLNTIIKEMGLFGVDSRNKFVPDMYKYSSIENRLDLLSGIINTDGTVTADGTRIVITTYSHKMALDITDIARSLGYVASIKDYDRTNTNSTQKYDEEIEYHVSIISEDYSKLHLSNKHKEKLNNKKIKYVKSIVDIEYVGKEESQCIMVDNPNHLYITKDYIVTHNTTLIKEVCEKLAGEEGYMFFELGQERGADAIEGINYINCPEWRMDYDELTNSAGFFDVCEDIIANKSTEYKDLRVVVWDTYDQLITIAEAESIRLWNKECREKNQPDKCSKTINGAWGGFGKGEKKAMELMFNIMADLRRVGVATIVIGHVKTKDVSDVVSGETYQTLTSDQQQNYFNALKKNLHFLGLAYIDRTIVKEKTGKKNIVTGKDIMANKVSVETRKIKFRDDNYAVDSGSRFAEIVPEIDMNSDAFIKALTDAIECERSKSGKTIEETKAEQRAIADAKAERVAQAEKNAKIQAELDNIKNKIINFFVENKTNLTAVKPVLDKCKELGYNNPNEIVNLEDANVILTMILN